LEIVAQGKYLPTIKEFSFMMITFGLTVFAWIFFRAESISHALSYISGILSDSLFTIPEFPGRGRSLTTAILVMGFVLVEWLGREEQYAIANLGTRWIRPLRWGMYYGIIVLILNFSGKDQQFIYFQF
jgi:alginate O-acetyltransferase complex protein AlgI